MRLRALSIYAQAQLCRSAVHSKMIAKKMMALGTSEALECLHSDWMVLAPHIMHLATHVIMSVRKNEYVWTFCAFAHDYFHTVDTLV